jgi:hypothetical protein
MGGCLRMAMTRGTTSLNVLGCHRPSRSFEEGRLFDS